MTTPNVPLRMEITIEVPGTPAQVWDAIATGNGISAWMMPTDVDEREGGAVVFHMGETDSTGTITGWDPPRRIEYSEPDWADLAQHPGAAVTPLVTEMIIEAQSGGTCVLRVVTSGFGVGDEWEQEFFDDMEKHWAPMFETLRLYLTHFPGQKVTSLTVECIVAGSSDAVWSTLTESLGAQAVGDIVATRGISAEVARFGEQQLLLRLSQPVTGFLLMFIWGTEENTAGARIEGYLFSDDAPAYVKNESPAWETWLHSLGQASETAAVAG